MEIKYMGGGGGGKNDWLVNHAASHECSHTARYSTLHMDEAAVALSSAAAHFRALAMRERARREKARTVKRSAQDRRT